MSFSMKSLSLLLALGWFLVDNLWTLQIFCLISLFLCVLALEPCQFCLIGYIYSNNGTWYEWQFLSWMGKYNLRNVLHASEMTHSNSHGLQDSDDFPWLLYIISSKIRCVHVSWDTWKLEPIFSCTYLPSHFLLMIMICICLL